MTHGLVPRSVAMVGVAAILFSCTPADEPPQALGTLEWDRVELVAEASEPILAIHVIEGERVEAAAAVLQLDDEPARARLAQLTAARELAQARLDEVLRGPREEVIAESKAALEGAESRLRETELEVKRQRDLVERRLSAQATLDRVIALRDSARAERDRASETLKAAVEGSTDEEIRQARHALGQAEAAETEQQLRVSRLSMMAPVEGWIDELPFEVGDRPRTGETVAVLLVGEGPYALAWLPEPMKARVQIGDELAVRIDGTTDRRGRVRYIAREAAFTPYYSLSERDRSRLVYRMEVDLPDAADLSAGTPLQVLLPTP